MADKAFLVDITKCQGCRACQVACKQWNGLPGEKTEFFEGTEYTNPVVLSAITWNHVVFSELDRSNPIHPVWSIKHTKCNHCIEANCLRVCPENAISKVDGWTIIDQDKCIGCGACVNACVYQVPQVNNFTHVNDVGQEIVQKDKSHKCNACTLNERDVPACVNTCPSYALQFGHRLTMIEQAQERLKEIKGTYPNACVYGLEEFGGLRVITVLKDKPEKYGLPTGKDAVAIDIVKAEEVKSIYAFLSIFTLGLPSLKRKAFSIAQSLSSGNRKIS